MGGHRLLSSSPVSPRKENSFMWPHALRCDPALATRPDLVKAMKDYQLISDNSGAWDPEPAVVVWARSLLEGRRFPRASELELEYLDSVLAAGKSINAAGFGGETALHVVAQHLRMLPACDREGERLAHLAWHHLVARGAESSAVDVDGGTPVERLTRQQCRNLLAAKRRTYSGQRYERVKLQEQDTMHARSNPDVLADEVLSCSGVSAAPSVTPRGGVFASDFLNTAHAPRARRRTTSKGAARHEAPTHPCTARRWAESLRLPSTVSGSKKQSMKSLQSPHVLNMSLESLSPPSSPGSHRGHAKIYYTPPPRFRPPLSQDV